MIPLKTIKELISKHSLLEKELSEGDVDKKLQNLTNILNRFVEDNELPEFLEKINFWNLPKEFKAPSKNNDEETILSKAFKSFSV